MEDVKEHYPLNANRPKGKSFNPCFNGRCKRTKEISNVVNKQRLVSILVLMEDVKELSAKRFRPDLFSGFNPCFNGRCKRTDDRTDSKEEILAFQSLF